MTDHASYWLVAAVLALAGAAESIADAIAKLIGV